MIGTVWLDRRTRGKPVWSIRFKGADGRKHRLRTEAQNRNEAKALLVAKLSEIAQCKAAGGEKAVITFKRFVEDEYLPWCEKVNRPRTYDAKWDRMQHLYPVFGDRKLKDISKADIKNFIAARRGVTSDRTKRALRPATVNRELMLLSNVFREAEERDYIDRNPCKGIRQLREENTKDRYLSADEEQRLMAACPAYLRPIVIVGVHTGMRLGELLRLTWGDVSFVPVMDHGRVVAQGQVKVRAENAKSHQSRHIPMSDTAHTTLRAMAPDAASWAAGKAVFTNPRTGKAFRDLGKSFESACGRAGIVDVTFHTLRHTYASRLVQAGVPIGAISKRLGHGDVKTTARYAHLGADHIDPREAAALDNPGVPSTQAVQATPKLRKA